MIYFQLFLANCLTSSINLLDNPTMPTKLFLASRRKAKGNKMINEANVLEVVKSITNTAAYFFNGTLFLETQDSKIATDVFFKICEKVTPAISFGKCGQNETSYDFI